MTTQKRPYRKANKVRVWSHCGRSGLLIRIFDLAPMRCLSCEQTGDRFRIPSDLRDASEHCTLRMY